MNDEEARDRLASLQQRLRAYVDRCRGLPGEFGALADRLQASVDRLAAITGAISEESPRRREAP